MRISLSLSHMYDMRGKDIPCVSISSIGRDGFAMFFLLEGECFSAETFKNTLKNSKFLYITN